VSRNVLNCRSCGQPMVETIANGDIVFIARVARHKRNGPRGACFWLVCVSCGAERDWTMPRG